MELFSKRKQRDLLLNKADEILKAAETGRRSLTSSESLELDTLTQSANRINTEIRAIESKNTITRYNPIELMGGGREGRGFSKPRPVTFSEDYGSAFFEYIASAGKKVDAALYEGAGSQGGYAVPITVDDQIVPLAPQELSVRRLATVIPTTNDIKIPVKASFGTATAKAETSAFTENEPTLSQITLSAFMAGIQENISWELAQDVPAFQAFAVDDMILAQQMYEENLYINGTGTGQAQGLIGNVGAGVWEEPDSNGNVVSIAGILDLIGTLNAVYHPNASFLMARATSIVLRKAQMMSNLFFPAFSRDANGQDRLFGYPVTYATAMPAALRGHAPVLFGDFKRGYVIGDRGGAGINVKVLDQPLATQGIIVLLAYRRTDGRVRRSEAIQQYNIAASYFPSQKYRF